MVIGLFSVVKELKSNHFRLVLELMLNPYLVFLQFTEQVWDTH